MRPHRLTFLAFALSGAAGLVYESVWSRYLALLVGHSAYAQILVIAIFLGGMGTGALAVSQRTEGIRRPLLLYVVAELGLALAALGFHPAYRSLAEIVERSVLPLMPGAVSAGLVQWFLAIVLIAPQTVLLGATFPLLAAGVVRRFPVRPGWTVAILYFVNSLGGAVGVLVAGFALLPAVGLPGALLAAAGLNVAAAGLVAVARGDEPSARSGEEETWAPDDDAGWVGGSWRPDDPPARDGAPDRDGARDHRVRALLLAVAFLTAVASFSYEIGWIRMLSLVMGSATHSFELMLSAFVFGLAVGGFAVRRHSDLQVEPLRLLAWIQWLMGAAALATLPLYAASFPVMGWMVRTLPGMDGGYAVFNLLRYGIGLAVMLPSTILAGMTLPLITGALVHAGAGERSFGWVYGANTLGSVVGVALAGLILLPALGLEGVLVAGAALDMALGAVLFGASPFLGTEADGTRTSRALLPAGAALVVGVAVAGGAAVGVRLDRSVLTSGVFRYGDVPVEGTRRVAFYEDGRTATVGVHVLENPELAVLTTNGKPDASLLVERIEARARDEPVEPRVVTEADAATQLFSPLVALAHAPDAERVANVGHGSGISGHALLGSPELGELVTIEIEPAVIRAANAFRPANQRAYEDPRSTFAIEDARTHFARSDVRYDLILSEPSNPWVSGTSSLFTVEFYRRVRDALTEDGVMAQWFQLYEMSDRLVLTVLAALHRVFPDYRAYLVGPRDLLVVAAAESPLRSPDWSILEYPGVADDLAYLPELTGPDLEATRLFDRRTLAPLLDAWEPVNSDFRPVLDYEAERARILRRTPTGIYRFATAEVDLAAVLGGDLRPPAPYAPLSARNVVPMERRTTGSGLRIVLEGRGSPPGPLPWGFTGDARDLQRFLRGMESGEPPGSWSAWARDFQRSVEGVQGVTSGWVAPGLFEPVEAYLERLDSVPAAVRELLAFRRGLAEVDVPRAVRGGEAVLDGTLPALDSTGTPLFHDAAVAAFLRAGRPADARAVMERLSDRAGYDDDDARLLLLEAWIRRAEVRGREEP